jgi:hypothetical protein
LHAQISSIFVLVWPHPSVTEMVASRPTRPDFMGIGMIARVPAELIEGAVNRHHRPLGPRFSRVGRVRGLKNRILLRGS